MIATISIAGKTFSFYEKDGIIYYMEWLGDYWSEPKVFVELEADE